MVDNIFWTRVFLLIFLVGTIFIVSGGEMFVAGFCVGLLILVGIVVGGRALISIL